MSLASSVTSGHHSTHGGHGGNHRTLSSASSSTKGKIQRSQSTQSKQRSPKPAKPLPSLHEDEVRPAANKQLDEDEFQPYENLSVIQQIREETEEEVRRTRIKARAPPPPPPKGQEEKVKVTVNRESPRATPEREESSGKSVKSVDSINSSSEQDSGRSSLAGGLAAVGVNGSGRSTPNLLEAKDSARVTSSGQGSLKRGSKREKFKSLGNLQIEQGLPDAPK